MDNCGIIRRTDLHFRAEYPLLTTEIFEVSENKFVIYCEGHSGDFDELKQKFASQKPVGILAAELSSAKPQNFIRIVPSMKDTEIAKNFEGVLMNRAQFISLLHDKFPQSTIYDLEDGNGEITLCHASYTEVKDGQTRQIFTPKNTLDAIQSFLNGMNYSLIFKLKEVKINPNEQSEEINYWTDIILARDLIRKVKPYLDRDRSLWHDNLDGIFSGSFRKEDLFFIDDEYSCLVDYTYSKNLDIRNLLLLYPVTFLCPPYNTSIDIWLKDLSIQRHELIELVARGRVKLVLQHDDQTYDQKFLLEVYEAQPRAIISQDALKVLIAQNIVQISNEYAFKNLLHHKKDLETFERLALQLYPNAGGIKDIITWPIRARRLVFDSFQHGGLKNTYSFGITNAFGKAISNNDFTLASAITTPPTHIAHALNATLFPDQDNSLHPFYSAQGELLKFYTCSDFNEIEHLMTTLGSEDQLSPIDIFELNTYISITELESILSKDQIFPHGKKLMDYLGSLDEKERNLVIQNYSNDVNILIGKQEKRKTKLELGGAMIKDLFSLVLPSPPLDTATVLSKNLGINNFINSAKEKLSPRSNRENNIHFLTQINRVARLKI